MKKKLNICILLGIIILMAIVLGSYLSTFVQPQIYVIAQISQASKQEYEKAMAQVMSSDKGIEKFRHINLKIKVTHPFILINGMRIEKAPSEQYLIKSYLEKNSRLQILGGGMSSNGEGTDYSEDITIYMKDMSEDELRSKVGNLRISISWQNIWNKKDSKIFYLKDYLE